MLVYIRDYLITRYLPTREALCAQLEAGLVVLDEAVDNLTPSIKTIKEN